MSGASSARCLTITWEIRNCSIILSEDVKEDCELKSPIWKTETRESKALWNLSLSNKNPQYFTFQLIRIMGHQVFDQCELSLISSDGEISLDFDQYHIFSIGKSIVLFNSQYFLPGDTLTIRCRMWHEELTTEDFIIRSVLQEVNFHWHVNSSNDFVSSLNLFEEGNMLFRVTCKSHRIASVDYMIQVEGLTIRCGSSSLVRCKLLIRGSDKYDVGRISNSFIDGICVKWTGYLTFAKFIKLNDIKLDFELIIATQNELQVSSRAESTKGAIDFETSSSFPGTLSNDLLLLYRDGTLGDVTLKTDDKSFSAHKTILSARSKVFRAMLESKHMKEGHSGTVDIDDIDSATMDRMLVFLYGESLDDMSWEEASELYYAADKYDIDILKRKCGEKLNSGLTVSNACDALVLTDTHADEELMKNTVGFLRDHDEVISSAEWKKLEDSNLRLAAKVTRDL